MDVDIRHVPVDKLVSFELPVLIARQQRVAVLLQEYTARKLALEDELQQVDRLLVFLQTEGANAELAQKLAQGDVVRVVCPTCKGTGMRPSSIVSGQISKGSAFETIGRPRETTALPDEQDRCRDCKGQRWIIMDRFKG